MSETKSKVFWQNCRKDHIIELRDFVSLDEASQMGQGADGFKFNVTDVTHYQMTTDGQLIVLHMERDFDSKDYKLFVLIDADETSIETLLTEAVPGYVSGTKGNLIEREIFGLFNPPEDEENFQPCDLEFAEEPLLSIDFNNGEDSIDLEGRITPKYPEFFQTYGHTYLDGMKIFTLFCDYAMDAKPNPYNRFFVLEEGGVDEDGNEDENGGLVSLYVGRTVDSKDISYF